MSSYICWHQDGSVRIAAAAQAWLHDEIQALDDANLIYVVHQQETDRRRADAENMLTL